MRTLEPDNLNRWIALRSRVVKEPEDLLLGMGSFTNVAQVALGELERRYIFSKKKRVPSGANATKHWRQR